MKILAKTGNEDIATVYLMETDQGKKIEFVESIQPPLKREDKWVLIISTLYGCPVGCRFCDAGGFYQGKISEKDMLAQIDYMIKRRYPDGKVPAKKFKIQFARMGEPSLNKDVLKVINVLPEIYDAPGLIPSISTVAPDGTDDFFETLMEIKKNKYPNKFQLQFSIHTTDTKQRDWLIPIKKWSFEKIAQYGSKFYDKNGRKITLNFALSDDSEIDPDVLLNYFDPEKFLIKITPVNPTYRATENKLQSTKVFQNPDELINVISSKGYDVILSIGELEENKIGSNCGQYVLRQETQNTKINEAYTYKIIRF